MTAVWLLLRRWRRHLLDLLLRNWLLLMVVLNACRWCLGCGRWLWHVVISSDVVLLLPLATK